MSHLTRNIAVTCALGLLAAGCNADMRRDEAPAVAPVKTSSDYKESRAATKTSTATPGPRHRPAQPAPKAEMEEGAVADSIAAEPAPARGPALKKSKRKSMALGRGQVAMNKLPPKPRMVAPPTPPVVPPSDSDHRGEEYTDHGVNKMTQTAKDRFSTFSVDVDTGSYTIARRKLNEGVMPPAASVRVEEFINYFSYNYPSPDSGAFGVYMEAAPSPFASKKDTYLLRVGVQGKRISAAQRKPVNLTFLVDVSGSMNRPDKLGLAKESLKMLTKQLRKGDSVALVTYAGSNRLVLPMTDASQKDTILKAIDDLRSGGGTAMSSGMELAYKEAMNASKAGHVNRVMVISDGDANIGPIGHKQILAKIKAYVDEGITMTTIGVGMGNYRDTLMEQLANKGNGNYYYLDSIKEARKVFSDQANGTLEVIAKDVKLQVEFNPKAISAYRLIGYENRDIADKDFRNDKVDAGEIGAGHSVTALYEVRMVNKAEPSLGYVRIRAKKPDGYKAAEQTFNLTAQHLRPQLNQASKDFQFSAAVAGFAEILRKSPYAKNLSYDLVHEVATSSAQGKSDRKEFLELVKKAKTMAAR